MTNNIDKQSFGVFGCEIVTGPIPVYTGEYCALQFVTEGELTSFVPISGSLTEGTYTGVTFPAGHIIRTPFTGVTPSAGVTVVAYKAKSFVPPEFDPSNLKTASLELWLDASDGVYIGGVLVDPNVATSGAVDAWKDKSPNGYWLTQTTLNDRPTYAFNGVDNRYVSFDGSNDFLISTSDKAGLNSASFAISGSTPRTIISVYKRFDSTQRRIVGMGATGTAALFDLTSEYYVRCGGGVTIEYSDQGTDNQTTIFYLSGTGNNLDSYDAYVDGGTSPVTPVSENNGSTTLATTSAQVTVGASPGGTGSYAYGDLLELLIYSGSPTTAERAKLFKYLNDKYSVY
jgi:hypothetical protein